MWHLIVPPIVVIACFALILWYLSLRGTHPEVAQRVRTAGDEHTGRWRLAIRGFFLRVLEKLAQRSKVISLRVHNSFHDFLQSVKEKRKISDKQQAIVDPPGPSWEDPAILEDAIEISRNPSSGDSGAEHASEDSKIPSIQDARETGRHSSFQVTTPLRRRSRDGRVTEDQNRPISVRPMISEHVVHPEKPPKRKSVARPIEEEMIARIAINPKDYTAYEALGDFYMERGDVQDAKECYRQVLKLSPMQRMVKMKIRRLEKLFSQKQG